MSAAPKLGVKMGPEDAKTYVDAINWKIAQRWHERGTNAPFMSKVLAGSDDFKSELDKKYAALPKAFLGRARRGRSSRS